MSIPLWIACDQPGWDLDVIHGAIRSLQAGHDPYADAMAIQEAFHRDLASHPNAPTPLSYVYSPITLPLLRLIGALPIWFSGTMYWLLYAVCALSLVWVGMQAVEDHERKAFLLFAPASLFFPGLLQHDVILSGNVALILYALVLLGAVFGWRRGQWHWCYLAILFASCFKAPLLILTAIPLLSARRQWLPAGVTLATGVSLFSMQSLLWPSLFRNFLQTLNLMFNYGHDFGCSPVGLLGNLLLHYGVPYSFAGTIIYVVYAVPIFAVLFYLSRQFLNSRFSLQQWLPVLLLGVFLLNPRLIEYDIVPLTIPMALIGWRLLVRFNSPKRAILIFASVVAVGNLFAVQNFGHWKQVEGIFLVIFFVAGCWDLLHEFRTAHVAEVFEISEPEYATV
ncbi:MAG: hypothetical protein P4K80_04360 [Acidobacteriaceae bacterium]|nr:hypothetical protein [Acidobacteriaceae bacterium]